MKSRPDRLLRTRKILGFSFAIISTLISSITENFRSFPSFCLINKHISQGIVGGWFLLLAVHFHGPTIFLGTSILWIGISLARFWIIGRCILGFKIIVNDDRIFQIYVGIEVFRLFMGRDTHYLLIGGVNWYINRDLKDPAAGVPSFSWTFAGQEDFLWVRHIDWLLYGFRHTPNSKMLVYIKLANEKISGK